MAGPAQADPRTRVITRYGGASAVELHHTSLFTRPGPENSSLPDTDNTGEPNDSAAAVKGRSVHISGHAR